MLTNQASSVAPEVAVELQAIQQTLEELLHQWQQCVKAEQCPTEKSTEFYNQAVKLIEQKKALEASVGSGIKPPTPAAEPTPAPAVEATANGSPPKKPTKKKATKVKVSLVMSPETQFADAPPALALSPPFEIKNAVTLTSPVIDSYSDAEALADGTLVDVSTLKVEIKGIPVTRMTTAIFARMDVAAQAFQKECEQVKVPFVQAVAWRNWIVSQIKQAVIKGDILQVPRTPTSGAIWIMENEGGGFTMLSPSDY